MATYQLRPMSVGEILDGAFVLLRRHFGALFTVAVVCLGVPTAIDVYVETVGGVILRPGLWSISLLLRGLGYLLVTGATVRIVSDAYLGYAPTAGEALGFAVGKMWPIFVSGVATTAVLVLAFIPTGIAFAVALPMMQSGGPAFLAGILAGVALVALPIYVTAGFAVVVQAVVLEPLPSATSGLGRSWTLTQGSRGKALALWFVVFCLMFAMMLAIGLVSAAFTAISPSLGIVGVAGMSVLMMLLYPLTSCVFTLLYYDLRVRKEAFDLELLSRQIGLAPTGA
jgi:hypothetical protein